MGHYAVSAVRYEASGVIIRQVLLHELAAGGMGPPVEIGRDQLIGAVERGRVVAVPSGKSEPFPIRLIQIRGRRYLRCDEFCDPSDDLTGLPSF
jgi:hypothetical protein